MHELRTALRRLWHTPVFTATAVLSLALGIGATTAMFTLADALLYRPLPIPQPQDVVRVRSFDMGGSERPILSPLAEQLRASKVFAGVCGFLTPLSTVELKGDFRPLSSVALSGDCFDTLKVRAALGRLITSSDDVAGAAPVAAISYEMWQLNFQGTPSIIGQTIRIDGRPFSIVGVVESRFWGLAVGFPSHVYYPLGGMRLTSSRRGAMPQYVFARLRPGQAREAARNALSVLWPSWVATAAPSTLHGTDRSMYLSQSPRLDPGSTGLDLSLRNRFGTPTVALLGISLSIMAIAALNLASLQLARALDRRSEYALRLALGATFRQIVRLVLSEMCAIAIAAAALAIGVAYACDTYLVSVVRSSSPTFALNIRPDVRSIGWSVLVSLCSLFVVAGAPLLALTHSTPADLRTSSSRITGTSHALRLLLVLQVGLTIVLVAAGAVLARNLSRLNQTPVGIYPGNVLEVRTLPRPGAEPAHFAASSYYDSILTRLEESPGIEAAAVSDYTPFVGEPRRLAVYAHGSERVVAGAAVLAVSDRFFEALGIRLLSGRSFRQGDDGGLHEAVVVSDTLAKALFGDDDPIGRFVQIGEGDQGISARILGVASDAALARSQEHNAAAIYRNVSNVPSSHQEIVVRSHFDTQTLRTIVSGVLDQSGTEFVTRVVPLTEARTAAMAQERLLAWLSGAFAALGLLLAAVGLYSLQTLTVANRLPEIAIRIAFGAPRRSIWALAVSDAGYIVIAGIAWGVPAAWLTTKTLLRTVGAIDQVGLPSLLWAICTLIIVTLAATVGPVQRALRVDPSHALRN